MSHLLKPVIKACFFPLRLYIFKFCIFINVTITLVLIVAKILESRLTLQFLPPSAMTSLALC